LFARDSSILGGDDMYREELYNGDDKLLIK